MKTDLEIQQNVMDELKWVPLLRSSEIGVAVKNGIVTLSGNVDTTNKKYGAEKAAKRVAGVKAVAEDIQVVTYGAGKKTDAEIAQAAITALKWHSSVPDEKVKLTVENGVVTLEGELEWEYQKTSAKNAIANMLGVRGIINNIKISPKPVIVLSQNDVKSSIIKALHRRAAQDADKIRIEIAGNKVTLTGTVHSWSEKEDAVTAAWSVPGVVWVENHIQIESDVYAEF